MNNHEHRIMQVSEKALIVAVSNAKVTMGHVIMAFLGSHYNQPLHQ